MSSLKLSADTRKRIQTMVSTNNGFEIAQVDLELRGPGDITGTQQSGIIDLKVANLARDGRILTVAREDVIELLEQDPDLNLPENAPVKRQVENFSDSDTYWSKIS
jgi:ATP-dependent DNA helicase RecG